MYIVYTFILLKYEISLKMSYRFTSDLVKKTFHNLLLFFPETKIIMLTKLRETWCICVSRIFSLSLQNNVILFCIIAVETVRSSSQQKQSVEVVNRNSL